MSKKEERGKLFKISSKCRRCNCEMVLTEQKRKDQATIQHNRFRFEDGYKTDITLYCHDCNQKDNLEKITSYNMKYNKMVFPLLNHEEIAEMANLIYRHNLSMTGTINYEGNLIKIRNGCIIEILDFYTYKLDILKKYMMYWVNHTCAKKGRRIEFEDYFNSRVKGSKYA